MSGYFGAISKALTAMILVTETVDIRNLTIVTLVAYITRDLLLKQIVYEAMLEKCYQKESNRRGRSHPIEIPVSDKIAGKLRFTSSTLPHNVLITTQVHNGKSQTVNGSTRMYRGDMIHLVIQKVKFEKSKTLL